MPLERSRAHKCSAGLFVVALASALASSSCAGNEDQDRDSLQGAQELLGLRESFRVKIATDSYAIDLKTAQLNATCMKAQGFDFDEFPVPPEGGVISPEFGVVDVESASELGYLVAPLPENENIVDVGDEAEVEQATQSPAYIEALYGEDTEQRQVRLEDSAGNQLGAVTIGAGCFGAANQAVFKSEENRVRYGSLSLELQALDAEIHSRALAAELVDSATALWSSCMGEAGFQYASSEEPQLQPWPHPRPSADEIAVATADATCKQKSGFTSEINSELSKILYEEGDRYRELLEEYNAIVDEALSE